MHECSLHEIIIIAIQPTEQEVLDHNAHIACAPKQ